VTAVEQTTSIARRAASIAENVAGPYAQEVDEEARFPAEAMSALKDEGLLGVLVPSELGGPGASMSEVAEAVTALSHQCASTAMIYAMHQIQVACLVRHGHTDYFRNYLRDLAVGQPLLASATTEAGIGGDTPHERVRSGAHRQSLQPREERSGHLVRGERGRGAHHRSPQSRQRA
jgi:acyl-CoA dehydrogenase